MFSIIIPLYNKELSIKNTIQSVLNQTCQDFEIVIVNDGSTDNSVEIVKDISDSRIRLIHQENQGVSAARNRGIKEAKCEWIAFLDGDDLWKENHLKEIKRMMRIIPKEKIYVTSFIYSDGRSMYKHLRRTSVFKIINYFKDALKEELMWTSVVIVHKNCLNEVGGFNEALKYGEDLDIWARLAVKNQIIKSNEITAIYRIEAENRSNHNQKIEHCFQYHINLTNVHDRYEYQYLYRLINKKTLYYLRYGDLLSFSKMIIKYKNYSFFYFFISKIKLKFLNFFK